VLAVTPTAKVDRGYDYREKTAVTYLKSAGEQRGGYRS
jgi:hypothetical protein